LIHLTLAPEPPSFKVTVREPGENALAALAGSPLPHARRGRPISATKSLAGKQVKKTIEDFPYWQACLDDLHAAYGGICAYYSYRIEKASLPHVDHFVAKRDVGAHLAYEWSNYRLTCGLANACKRDYPDICDPTTIEDGWFQLDLVTLDVSPDPKLDPARRKAVARTITRLKLREGAALETRQHAMKHFRNGVVPLKFLESDHPFLAKELLRQGILTKEQLPAAPPAVHAPEPELLLGETSAPGTL